MCPFESPFDDALVAADALADLVQPALLDLAREERVGDRRAGRADDVPDAGADDLGHLVGVREAPDADDRPPVARRTWPVHSSCQPAWKKRDTPESTDHSEIEPMLTSQRWTWRSASRMNSRLSSSGTPASAPPGSTAIRATIAQSRPTASSQRLEQLEPEPRAVARASRRTRRCAGCRTATGTAPAGRCARRRRRRCRSPRRASARPPSPSRPGRGGCRPSSWRAGRSRCSRRRSATAPIEGSASRRCGRGRRCGTARCRPARRARAPARPSRRCAPCRRRPTRGRARTAPRRRRARRPRTRCRPRPSRPPPSSPRWCACESGFALPKPVQWGTW